MQPSIASFAGLSSGPSAPRSLHESLVELLPDAVLALDIAVGRFVLANAAAERLLGWSRAHLARCGLRDLVRPWEVAQVDRVEAALAAEGQWRGELWLARHDGTFVPTDVTARAWNLDARTLAQFCIRDASARWRDDAVRRVVGDAAERLAATLDDREALRTLVTAALPGLADAALVELEPVDGDEPIAVAALADPTAPVWPAVTVDEAPTVTTFDAIRRGNTLTVPLVANGRRLGVLTLRRAGHRPWEPSEQPLVEALAGHAAHAIDQARRWSGARQQLGDRAAMLRILSLIDTDATPREVYELLLDEAQATIPAEDGGGAHWDYERGVLNPAIAKSPEHGRCIVDKKLMVAVAANERCALVENDYQRVMGTQTPAGRAGARAVLAVPLLHGEHLVGSLSISQISSGRRFQPSDARRLERLASVAATTISGMARQRAAGAKLATSETAHLLNNSLTVTMGSLDMVRASDDLAPSLAPLVDAALDGLGRAADHLAQIRHLSTMETIAGTRTA